MFWNFLIRKRYFNFINILHIRFSQRWEIVILLRDTLIDYSLPLQLHFLLCKTASGAGFVSFGTIIGISVFVDSSFSQPNYKSNWMSHLDLPVLRSVGT